MKKFNGTDRILNTTIPIHNAPKVLEGEDHVISIYEKSNQNLQNQKNINATNKNISWEYLKLWTPIDNNNNPNILIGDHTTYLQQGPGSRFETIFTDYKNDYKIDSHNDIICKIQNLNVLTDSDNFNYIDNYQLKALKILKIEEDYYKKQKEEKLKIKGTTFKDDTIDTEIKSNNFSENLESLIYECRIKGQIKNDNKKKKKKMEPFVKFEKAHWKVEDPDFEIIFPEDLENINIEESENEEDINNKIVKDNNISTYTTSDNINEKIINLKVDIISHYYNDIEYPNIEHSENEENEEISENVENEENEENEEISENVENVEISENVENEKNEEEVNANILKTILYKETINNVWDLNNTDKRSFVVGSSSYSFNSIYDLEEKNKPETDTVYNYYPTLKWDFSLKNTARFATNFYELCIQNDCYSYFVNWKYINIYDFYLNQEQQNNKKDLIPKYGLTYMTLWIIFQLFIGSLIASYYVIIPLHWDLTLGGNLEYVDIMDEEQDDNDWSPIIILDHYQAPVEWGTEMDPTKTMNFPYDMGPNHYSLDNAGPLLTILVIQYWFTAWLISYAGSELINPHNLNPDWDKWNLEDTVLGEELDFQEDQEDFTIDFEEDHLQKDYKHFVRKMVNDGMYDKEDIMDAYWANKDLLDAQDLWADELDSHLKGDKIRASMTENELLSVKSDDLKETYTGFIVKKEKARQGSFNPKLAKKIEQKLEQIDLKNKLENLNRIQIESEGGIKSGTKVISDTDTLSKE